jgi:malate dehydrogenase (quinone)
MKFARARQGLFSSGPVAEVCRCCRNRGFSESKGLGGFPIGGQWLVCDDSKIVAQHQTKVYGQAQGEATTMAVPHLDTQVIDGTKALLFGPFAAWTTRVLKET